MEDNQKYNKRRRSYTEFRTSYSDNKDYFISTDRKSSWMPIVKYIIIAVAVILFTFAGFLITDALLNISEAPYEHEKTTVEENKTYIDDKYFDNLVTEPADKNEDNTNNNSAE